ncbi:hypothetical protein D3C74_196650 [compost metagenome]
MNRCKEVIHNVRFSSRFRGSKRKHMHRKDSSFDTFANKATFHTSTLTEYGCGFE